MYGVSLYGCAKEARGWKLEVGAQKTKPKLGFQLLFSKFLFTNTYPKKTDWVKLRADSAL